MHQLVLNLVAVVLLGSMTGEHKSLFDLFNDHRMMRAMSLASSKRQAENEQPRPCLHVAALLRQRKESGK
jgi:hypothetical protein